MKLLSVLFAFVLALGALGALGAENPSPSNPTTSATYVETEQQFSVQAGATTTSGEIVVGAHENIMFDFFAMTKHRLHVLIHGCPCDPSPLKIKAKALPPRPIYRTVVRQIADPITYRDEVETVQVVKKVQNPPTYHEVQSQVLVPQPKLKDRALPQPPCVFKLNERSIPPQRPCAPCIKLNER